MNLIIFVENNFYGSVTVKDMIKRTRYDENVGIQGYTLNPELRFNFNRNHKIP